jgi:hypothetical protein
MNEMYGSVIAYDKELTDRVTAIEEALATNPTPENADIYNRLENIENSITDLEDALHALTVTINLLGTAEQLAALLNEAEETIPPLET